MDKRTIIITCLILPALVCYTSANDKPSSKHKQDISITILYDNYIFTEGLKPDWGFSCILKGTEKTILFDAGTKGELFLENIEKLTRILTDSGIGILSDSNQKEVSEIAKAIDKKILGRAREIYSERMNSALIVLSTNMPYDLAEAQLNQLSDEFDPNNPLEALAGTFVPAFSKIYHQDTMRKTSLNATIAAVDICLSRIKTGKLPDKLPADLPKDLFSGKDFDYEKNNDGFILRCPGRDSDTYKFEFKVKK